MKRLARLAVVGTIALGSTMAAASAAPIIPNSFSQTNPSIVHVWGGCGWGVIATRGAAACRTAGGIIVNAPTMDTGRTGGLTMVVTTIRIGTSVLVWLLTDNQQQRRIKEE